MLFTRCPSCDTTFRVTDEALTKAGGQVRCGRCASVFNAYAELRETTVPSRPAASRFLRRPSAATPASARPPSSGARSRRRVPAPARPPTTVTEQPATRLARAGARATPAPRRAQRQVEPPWQHRRRRAPSTRQQRTLPSRSTPSPSLRSLRRSSSGQLKRDSSRTALRARTSTRNATSRRTWITRRPGGARNRADRPIRRRRSGPSRVVNRAARPPLANRRGARVASRSQRKWFTTIGRSSRSRALVGPLVQATYGVFGAPIAPRWDIAQYQILDWVRNRRTERASGQRPPGNYRAHSQSRPACATLSADPAAVERPVGENRWLTRFPSVRISRHNGDGERADVRRRHGASAHHHRRSGT